MERATLSSSPQWTRASTLAAFLVGSVTLVAQVICCYLLHVRRKKYPIQGRGYVALQMITVATFIAVLLLTLSALLFSTGAMPCGVQYIVSIPATVAAMAYLSRGWILCFRLEILNFLAERQWRLEKNSAIRAKRGDEASSNDADGGGGSTEQQQQPQPQPEHRHVSSASTAKSDSNAVERFIRVPASDEEEEEDLSPETIEGYWFVSHRKYMEPRYSIYFCLLSCAYICSTVTSMLVLDPDVAVQRQWRAEHDLPPDPEDYGTQFSDGHFFHSPPCLVMSVKIFVHQSWFYLFPIPIGLFYIFKLRVNQQRQTKRAKQQKEFYKRMQESISSPSTPAPLVAAGSLNDEMDDSRLVKQEFFLAVNEAILANVFYFFPAYLAPSWTPFLMILGYDLIFTTAVIPALHRSFAISRRHREAIMQSRGGGTETSSKGMAAAEMSRHGSYATTALAHHRPFYTLKYILHTPTTYPVLLKFLQKEYSSENALFYTEVRELKKLCVYLERNLASWPQGRDEDGGAHAGSSVRFRSGVGSQHHHMAMASAAAATGASRARRASVPLVVQVELPSSNAMATAMTPQQQQQTRQQPQQQQLLTPSGGGGGGGSNGIELTVPIGANSSPAPATPSAASLNGALTPLAPLMARDRRMSPLLVSSVSSSPIAQTHTLAALNIPAATPPIAVSTGSGAPTSGAQLQLHTPQSKRGGGSGSMPASPSLRSLPTVAGAAAAVPPMPPMAMLPSTVAIDHAARFSSLHADAHRAKAWCLRIYAEFLAKSAIYEINIPTDLSALVSSQVAQLRKYEPTPLDGRGVPRVELTMTEEPQPPPFALSLLFAATQLTILNLMQTDSFRRFILTAEFRALLAAADDAEVKRRETQAVQSHMAAALQEAALALPAPANKLSPLVGSSRAPAALHHQKSFQRLSIAALPGTPLPGAVHLLGSDNAASPGSFSSMLQVDVANNGADLAATQPAQQQQGGSTEAQQQPSRNKRHTDSASAAAIDSAYLQPPPRVPAPRA